MTDNKYRRLISTTDNETLVYLKVYKLFDFSAETASYTVDSFFPLQLWLKLGKQTTGKCFCFVRRTISSYTECITDLDKLNWVQLGYGGLVLGFRF